MILSTCDSQCLLQLSKVISDPRGLLSCTMSHSSTDIGCRSQSLVYTMIELLTIHGSKGLEYDVVILLRFADKMMISENYEHSNFVA